MERREAEAIYEQGRDAVVGVLLALSAQNERLEAQVAKLTAKVSAQDERIASLERQLGRSSRNSSQPPSADPPSAPLRRGKDPSGRKPGAQPGHEGKGRPLLPAWAVDEVIEHWPSECSCGRVFCDADRIAIGAPARRQVEELPVMAVRVTEYQVHRVCCPGCGAAAAGELPAAVAASAFGPRRRARGRRHAELHARSGRRRRVRLYGRIPGLVTGLRAECSPRPRSSFHSTRREPPAPIRRPLTATSSSSPCTPSAAYATSLALKPCAKGTVALPSPESEGGSR